MRPNYGVALSRRIPSPTEFDSQIPVTEYLSLQHYTRKEHAVPRLPSDVGGGCFGRFPDAFHLIRSESFGKKRRVEDKFLLREALR